MAACNKYCKSTLSAYTNTSITVPTNTAVTFNSVYENTGSSVTLTPGTSTINLTKSGIYVIHYTAIGSMAEETAGIISLELYRNGVAVPVSYSAVDSTTTSDVLNLNGTAIIDVNTVCPYAGTGSTSIPITLVNTGIEATYSFVSINIIKEA